MRFSSTFPFPYGRVGEKVESRHVTYTYPNSPKKDLETDQLNKEISQATPSEISHLTTSKAPPKTLPPEPSTTSPFPKTPKSRDSTHAKTSTLPEPQSQTPRHATPHPPQKSTTEKKNHPHLQPSHLQQTYKHVPTPNSKALRFVAISCASCGYCV